MSISELIEHRITEAFPFEVELRKLYHRGIESPHAGFYRNDCSDVDGWLPLAVGQGYVPHTRQDVIEATTAAAVAMGITKEHELDVQCSWGKNGHRVAVTPSDEDRVEIAQNDWVYPTLVVRANYGRAFTLTAAIKRELCSNLMMTRIVSGTTVSLRHRSNFRHHFTETVDRMKSVTC